MFNEQYFLILTLFLGIVWFYFFLREKSTRVEMLIIGAVAVCLTPVFLFLGLQTITGDVSLADFAFSFFFAGIGAVVFQAVLGKHYRIGHPLTLPSKHPTEQWFLRLMVTTTSWAWLTVIFLLVVKTNAVQSIIAATVLVGSYMIASRKDLFWNAIWSGIFMAIIFFLLYVVTFTHEFSQITGPFLLNLPWDALTLSLTTGFVLGPLYEFVRGIRLSRPGR